MHKDDVGHTALGADHGGDGPRSVDTLISNQQSGCGLIMTEFTSADGLSRMRESKRKRYLSYDEDEHPISAQLFGSDPVTLADAAKIVEDAGFSGLHCGRTVPEVPAPFSDSARVEVGAVGEIPHATLPHGRGSALFSKTK